MGGANGADLLFTSIDGFTWTNTASPCPTGTSLASIAVTASTAGFLCIGQGYTGHTDKQLLETTDGGRTYRVAGTPPSLGAGGTLAAPTSSIWVLATASGLSSIDRSTDGGRTWPGSVSFPDGGSGFSDFGFTTSSQGVAIHGPFTDQPELILSRDGGATWGSVRF